MGKADWSLDQLERDLSKGFALLGRAERSGGLGAGETAALAEGVLRCMNGALLKVSESLEAQGAMRRELAGLREELRQVGESQGLAKSAQDERIRVLEAEVAALRAERDRMQQVLGSLVVRDDHNPPDALLTQPLVLRSSQAEFLGVSDKNGQPLCLADFLRLVECGACRERVVGTLWNRHEPSWCLTVSISGPGAGHRRCFVLATEAMRTPSGNEVTLLQSMHIDGAEIPRDFVLQMFRQLRDSLQE